MPMHLVACTGYLHTRDGVKWLAVSFEELTDNLRLFSLPSFWRFDGSKRSLPVFLVNHRVDRDVNPCLPRAAKISRNPPVGGQMR
jgi:hypothetical protein